MLNLKLVGNLSAHAPFVRLHYCRATIGASNGAKIVSAYREESLVYGCTARGLVIRISHIL